MSLSEIKAAILKKRRQRIRRSTYEYVASVMLEDTAVHHPFRDRMVIDWWSRVVDPLEAESYDRQRLTYFRMRLAEHKKAPVRNAGVRQGNDGGAELRRLSPEKFGYLKHQISRLADRRMNYAAAQEVFRTDSRVYESLALGLIALKSLRPSPKGFMLDIAWAATTDVRFAPLIARVQADPDGLVPGKSTKWIEQRLGILSSLEAAFWYPEQDYLFELRRAGLIRKLEGEYLKKI